MNKTVYLSQHILFHSQIPWKRRSFKDIVHLDKRWKDSMLTQTRIYTYKGTRRVRKIISSMVDHS